MKQYFNIVREVLAEGVTKQNRTGVETLSVSGMLFKHDMDDGFPLLTTKKVPFRLVASELEFFIKGLHNKKWLQERDNHIWDEWCDPRIVSYGTDELTKDRMKKEDELGNIYGVQWRRFGVERCNSRIEVDQLATLVNDLKTNPNSRRMIVTAWNPLELYTMALPPCHYAFQVTVDNGYLNLMWNQRSVDVALGLPFNIASYAILLHLLAKEAGYKEGKLVGFLGDTHIYKNHIHGLQKQLTREPKPLPFVHTPLFKSIFDWNYTDTVINNYNPHPGIKFSIAV